MQTLSKTQERIVLPSSEVPTSYYNIQADLGERLPPPLDPQTKAPMDPAKLERIFAKDLIQQEISAERFIPIPEQVREAYIRIGRPTPLVHAVGLEKLLGTPAKIYYKAEYLSPTGSHKPNTAIPQAFYNKRQGIQRIVTESGAGQWGSALAMASAFFDLECQVYMVRISYNQKPGRRTMMETYGARVVPSPSKETKYGQSLLAHDPNHPGTLGIAITEALEDTVTHDNTRYCLGSVLNHVLLHQSIVGLETKKQLDIAGVKPDIFAGCIGGGSNFAGFAYPFIGEKLRGRLKAEFVAVEPKAVPSTTRGSYRYDYGDSGEMTPLMKMHTIGHKYLSPPIHSGGLRYHGKAPSLCYLIDKKIVRSIAYHQNEVFEAARTFARAEGLIPAPETAHVIKYVIDEANRCKKSGESKTIVFNNCGHGLLDLKAYEDYLANKLVDYEPGHIDLDYLPKI